jgi:hypothetical protein
MNGVVVYNGGMNYSWEYKKIHLRPSVNASFGHNGSYSFLNGLKNKEESYYANTTVGANYDMKELMTIRQSTVPSAEHGRIPIR